MFKKYYTVLFSCFSVVWVEITWFFFIRKNIKNRWDFYFVLKTPLFSSSYTFWSKKNLHEKTCSTTYSQYYERFQVWEEFRNKVASSAKWGYIGICLETLIKIGKKLNTCVALPLKINQKNWDCVLWSLMGFD